MVSVNSSSLGTSTTDMTISQRNYIIVTPVKNEGVNFSDLVQSMVTQTLKPILWVIVDDGSTDNTPEIIRRAQEEYNWILSIRMSSSKRDIGLHIASVIRKGFDFAIEYCKKNGVDYSYLGNVDGDLTLEHTFFENLLKEFEKNPKLGIAGGGTKCIIGDRVVYVNEMSVNEPSGGHMLIKRDCYKDCGGIPLSYSWDSVLKAKARLRGWRTQRFEENIATEIYVCNTEGYWERYVHSGKASHYLNLHPLHVMIKSVKYSFKRYWYTGIAYLVGYLSSVINRGEKIDDEEVKKYFWTKWMTIYKQHLFMRKR